MQEKGPASVVEEQSRRAVAIAATGLPDEVGAGLGAECHLEGHLEVESPDNEGLELGGLRCPSKPGVFCQWRLAVGGERQRMVQEEVGPSVMEEQTIRAVASVEPGALDEVGAGEGAECHLEGHLEVKSP